MRSGRSFAFVFPSVNALQTLQVDPECFQRGSWYVVVGKVSLLQGDRGPEVTGGS